jgi:hypothetical protein
VSTLCWLHLSCRRRRLARIQRPHDADTRQHGVAAALGYQHQRLNCRVPCRCIVLGLGQLSDVIAGVAQGAQLASSIVPHGADQDTNLVLEDFGRKSR